MTILNNKDKEIDIIALKFPDTVRTRPGKLVGAVDNPDVILREAIDNAKDEAFGSSACDRIFINIKSGKNGSYYVVADNGRGIPIWIDEETGLTKAELAISTLDAGSKFSKESVDEISTGTHGVGVSCTNALSNDFILLSRVTSSNYNRSLDFIKTAYETLGEGELFYYTRFQKGIKLEDGCDKRDVLIEKFGFEFPEGMSTIVAFIPDETIFESTTANYSKKSLAYTQVVLDKFYNKKVEIEVDGSIIEHYFTPYKYEFIKRIEVESYSGKMKSAVYYVNFEVNNDLSRSESTGSVNSLIVDRGVHINHTKMAFVESLKQYFGILHDNTLNGLYLNVICVSPDVDYNSQIKTNCVNISGLTSAEVGSFLIPEFKKIFKNNRDYFEDHVTRLNEFNRAVTKITAMQKVKELVSTVSGGNRVQSKIPKSVIDCSSKDRSQTELFIVEGNSASGIMIQARDPLRHAIIELRGVPLNAINADLEVLMENPEMESIIKAYGGGVNELYNPDSVRYGKVIVAADADADGGRIASLIVGMFAKKVTRAVQDGNIFVAMSPLYIQGSKYIYPTDDLNKELDRTKPFTRIKGLGELDVHHAKNIFFNDDTRKLLRITLDNVDWALRLLTSSYYRKELMVSKGLLRDEFNLGII